MIFITNDFLSSRPPFISILRALFPQALIKICLPDIRFELVAQNQKRITYCLNLKSPDVSSSLLAQSITGTQLKVTRSEVSDVTMVKKNLLLTLCFARKIVREKSKLHLHKHRKVAKRPKAWYRNIGIVLVFYFMHINYPPLHGEKQ